MGIIKKNKKDVAAEPAVQAEEKAPAKKTKKKAAPAKSTKKTASVGAMAAAHRVLVRPLLSEKTTMQEAGGQYTFEVAKDATKVDVKNAVKAVYGVDVKKVNMIHMDGKKTRFGRFQGTRKGKKKAIVILPKGSTMSIHEGV